MIDGYTTALDANRKRIDAERHAARQRLIRWDRSDGWAGVARHREARAAVSFRQRVQRGLLAALARPRASLLPR